MLLPTCRLPNRLLWFVVAALLVLTAPAEASLAHAEGDSQSANGSANPVTINFDSLQTNVVLPSTYSQIANFSSYGGATISTAYDCYYGWGGSCPNGIIATSGSGYYYWPTADLYVNFAIPVSGLTFRLIGSQAGGASGYIDVYVNNSYYTSTSFDTGNGWPGQVLPPYTVNLSGIQHITAIAIRYVTNYDYWYYSNYELYYDDFSFTPELFANIINPRVNGGLDQTTQNALLGGDVVLQASTSNPGGTYAWSFTPENLVSIVSGSPTSSSITIRSTDIGTINAKLTYTRNGVSVSPSVNINVIIPTLTNFTATEASDQLNRGLHCSNAPSSISVTYSLGCYQGGAEDGIIWSATAQIPSGTYLSDPARSGIKFVQAVSVYRKRLRDGNTQCRTARTSPSDVASGWQLDTDDPYNHVEHPPRYFSEGNVLTMTDFDAPAVFPEGTPNGVFYSDDANFVSDQFEIYVFYFTTNASPRDPAQPLFQRAMSLQGSPFPFARLAWGWGGQTVFHYFSVPPTLLYRRDFTTTFVGSLSATGTNQIVPMATNAATGTYQTCAGTTPTSNPIDGSRFFVTQLYWDFLNRAPDQDGLNYWRHNITYCGFDPNCIDAKRVDVTRAFFYCPEFIGAHPELGGPRGNHDYNSAFIYWCYRTFLQREPNAYPDVDWSGFNYWVGVLDSTNPDASDAKYNHIIRAFLVCPEYRSRFGPP